MATWTVFKRAKHKILTGAISFSANSFRAHLFTSDSSISASDDVSTVGSIDDQLVATRGYVSSGVKVSNQALVASVNNWKFSTDGFCWSANGGNLGSTAKLKFVVIAVTAGVPICFATLSTAGFAVAAGSAIKINGGAASTGTIFELS